MAKVKYTALLADMRNSIGGTTYSKNKGGAYSKTKASPYNPQSINQMAYRTLFANATGTWRTLSDDQRNTWDNAVTQWQRTDVFGDIVSPSGFNLFMRLNLQLQRIGQDMITVPNQPTTAQPQCGFGVKMNVPAQTVIIGQDEPYTFNPWVVVFRATKEVSAGRNYVRNFFCDIKIEDDTFLGPLDVTTEYLTRFGAFNGTGKVYWSSVKINRYTGQIAQPTRVLANFVF